MSFTLSPILKRSIPKSMNSVRHFSSLIFDKAFINGEWIDAESKASFCVSNPINGEEISRVPDLSPRDVEASISSSLQAFHSWKNLTAKQRCLTLLKWANLIVEHEEEIAQLIHLENGKSVKEALAEVSYGVDYITWFAEEGRRVHSQIIPSPHPMKTLFALKSAVGPSAMITPWNFPLAMITRKVGAALAAGCSAMVKPSEETPLTALAIAQLGKKAGFIPGLFNVLTAGPANSITVGKLLCEDKRIAKLSFTGSSRVGKILMSQAAFSVKKVTMELGGNASFIVFADASLDKAISDLISSKLRCSGQVERLVNDAISHGANCVLGQSFSADGRTFEPTVLSGIDSNMLISHEEIFGPVFAIRSFKTIEEVETIANTTEFGLSSYAYTTSLSLIQRLVQSIEVGILGINEATVSTVEAPFCGIKESGIGIEGSHFGIEEYLNVKLTMSIYNNFEKVSHGLAPKGVQVLVGVEDEIGALKKLLSIFEKHKVDVSHIESRPSKLLKGVYEFLVEFKESEELSNLPFYDELSKSCKSFKVVSDSQSHKSIPWFPKRIKDLDKITDNILSCGEELEADHPGFNDNEYRKRRQEISKIAHGYVQGTPIPYVIYTAEEKGTWKEIFGKLKALFPTHACREFNHVFSLLVENGIYKPDEIPQLDDVSNFLKGCTGFTLRPAAGLLSSRDFLSGLAFRVFHSTQYIRHSSMPLYTPEPDICHELLGHVPLLAHPSFARFSQEIGLASLGISDEDIEKLATIYWFTVEFGLCKQNGELRAYGAGLLSSFGELQYAISAKPEIRNFDPDSACLQKYPITTYQPILFSSSSFEEIKDKISAYTASIERPFQVMYNPYTQTIEILDDKESIGVLLREIKWEVEELEKAFFKTIWT